MDKLRRILALALTINMMFSNVPLGSFSAAGDPEPAEQISEMQQEESVIAEIDEPVNDAAMDAEKQPEAPAEELPLLEESDGAVQLEDVSVEPSQAQAEEEAQKGEGAAGEVQQPDPTADEVQPKEEAAPAVSNEAESVLSAPGTPEQQSAPEADAANLPSDEAQPVRVKVGDQIEAALDTRIELIVSSAQNLIVTAEGPVDLFVCKKGTTETVSYQFDKETRKLEARFRMESGTWELSFSSDQPVDPFQVIIAEEKAEQKEQSKPSEINAQSEGGKPAGEGAEDGLEEAEISPASETGSPAAQDKEIPEGSQKHGKTETEEAPLIEIFEVQTEVENETEGSQDEILETEPILVETEEAESAPTNHILNEETTSQTNLTEEIAIQQEEEEETPLQPDGKKDAFVQSDTDEPSAQVDEITIERQAGTGSMETPENAETETETQDEAAAEKPAADGGQPEIETAENAETAVDAAKESAVENSAETADEAEAEPVSIPAIVDMPVTIQEYPDGDALYNQLFGIRLRRMTAGRKTATTIDSASEEAAAENGARQGSSSGYRILDLKPANEAEAEIYHVELSLPEAINMLGGEYNNVRDVQTDLQVYHVIYSEDGTPSVEPVSNLTWTEQNGQLQALAFDTDGFSPYVIRYTVDFHYGVNDYSIPGESQILLSELIAKLNIMHSGALLNVADVSSVSFTDEHLVNVQEVSGLITYNNEENVNVGDKDFLLSSLEAFNTDEKLTIVLNNGETIEVGVTDAQDIHDDGTYIYALDSTNKTATITGLSESYSGDGNLNIPNTVNIGTDTYVINAIGDSAFAGEYGGAANELIKEVTINSQTGIAIGESAFDSCPNMTGDLVGVTTIGSFAFWDTKVRSITMLGVNNLGSQALEGMKSPIDFTIKGANLNIPHGIISQTKQLKSITVDADSITFNSWCAQGDYYGNSALETITIKSNSPIDLDVYQVFGDHKNASLKSITINAHVTAVGGESFKELGSGSNAVTVSFNGGVDRVYNNAFKDFNGANGSRIIINNNMADTAYTEGESFPKDSRLTIIFNDGELSYEPIHDDALTYEEEGDNLIVSGLYADEGGNTKSTFTVPKTLTWKGKTYHVTAIKEGAFKGQSGLNVTVAGDIEVRGAYVNDGDGSTGAFAYITDTTVTFQGNTALKASAFQGASNLNVKANGTGLDLGQKAFAFAKGLTLSTSSATPVKGSAYNVFQGTSGELEFLGGVQSIGGYSFLTCNNLKITTTTADTYKWYDYGLSQSSSSVDVIIKAKPNDSINWYSWGGVKSFTVNYDAKASTVQSLTQMGNNGTVPVVINYNSGVGTICADAFANLKGAAGSAINIKGTSATVESGSFPDDANLTVNFIDATWNNVTGAETIDNELSSTTVNYKTWDLRKDSEKQKLLSDLVNEMDIQRADGTKVDVTEVESVAFSAAHAVTATRVAWNILYNEKDEEAVNVGRKDFLLTSGSAFNNEEVLTITMTDGEIIKAGTQSGKLVYDIGDNETLMLSQVLKGLGQESVLDQYGRYTNYGGMYYIWYGVYAWEGDNDTGSWKLADSGWDLYDPEYHRDVTLSNLNKIPYQDEGYLQIYVYGDNSSGYVTFTSGESWVWLYQSVKPKLPQTDGVFLYKIRDNKAEIVSFVDSYAGEGVETVPAFVTLPDQESEVEGATKTYPVAAIQPRAFYNDSRLKELTFEDAEGAEPLRLDSSAIFYAPELTRLSGERAVELQYGNGASISDNAKLAELNLHVTGDTRGLGVNNALERIELTFEDDGKLTVSANTITPRNVKTLTIHAKELELKDWCFYGKNSLETLIVDTDEPVTMGWYVLKDLASLTTVEITGGMTYIKEGAFAGDTALTEVTLGTNGDNGGNDLTIEKDAFKDCAALTSTVTCRQIVESADGTVTIPAVSTGVPLGAMLVKTDIEEDTEIKAFADTWYKDNDQNYPIDDIKYFDLSLVAPNGNKVTGVAVYVLMGNQADNRPSIGTDITKIDKKSVELFHKTENGVEQIHPEIEAWIDTELRNVTFHVDSLSPFALTVLGTEYHDDMFWYAVSGYTGNYQAMITGIYDGDPENPVTELVFSGKTHDANEIPVIGIDYEALHGDKKIPGNTNITSVVFTADGIKNTLKKTSSGYETPEDLFSGCTALEYVRFGEKEDTSIGGELRVGMRAFEGCTGLKTFVNNINTSYIQSTAFSGCTGLETVIFTGKDKQNITDASFSSAAGIRYLRIDNPYDMSAYAFHTANGTAFVQNNDSPINENLPNKIGKFDTYVFAGIPWWMSSNGLSGSNAPKKVYIANGNLPGANDLIGLVRNAGANLTDVYMDFDRADVSFADDLDKANANVKIHYHENDKTSGFYLDGVNGNDETGDGSYEKPYKTFAKLAEEWDNLTVDGEAEPTVVTDTAITESVNEAMAAVSVNQSAGTFTTSITKEKIAYIKNTVTTNGETWESPDASNPIVLNRDPDFHGVMVQNDSGLSLRNVVLDGGSEAGVAATAPIINSKANLEIHEGAIIRNNNRTSYGYPDGAGGIYASGHVAMDGGEISGNTGMYGGGIQICGSLSVFDMSGGVIEENTANHEKAYGGGVNVSSGATMNLSGGEIRNNVSTGSYNAVGGAGGGIALGADVSGMCQGARLVMTGGTIDGNESAQSGGGLFIQTNCTANITAGNITNNTCHGGAYGGGGIYANGVRDDTEDGRLYLNNVLITGNTANETGGGYAGCCTSTAYIYMGNGAALYGNSAGDNSDFHVGSEYHITNWGMQSGTPYAFVSQYMFNGTEYHWKNVETGSEMTAAELARIDTTTSMRAYPDGSQPTTAAVIITGNHSDTKAGGVGSNGFVSIGDKPEPNDVKWTPTADKTLYGRDMMEGETFTFTVYEEKTSQGLNFWWTRYNDVKVGTGSVTGAKNGTPAAISFTEIDLGEKSSANIGEIHTYLVKEEKDDEDDLLYSDYYLAFNVIIGERLNTETNKPEYYAELLSIERGRIIGGEFEYENAFDGTVSERANATENFGRIRMRADKTEFVNTKTWTYVKVVKKWTDEDGQEIKAPEGATVTLQLLADGKPYVRKQGYTNPIQLAPITLDGVWDYDGEANPWMAVWDFPSLPIYRIDNNGQMYHTAESGNDYDRIEYTVVEIANTANLQFAPASPNVELVYQYDEYHIAGRTDDNGYRKGFMFTGEVINGQGALEISKTVKVSRDGQIVPADSDEIRNKVYYIQVSTILDDETYYVTLNDEGLPELTAEQPAGEKRLKVSMAEKLKLSPLPCGTYTVEEISSEDELAIVGMTQVTAESVTLREAIVAPAETAEAALENVYGNSRYCVAVTKQWDDHHNQDGVRPDALYVELYRDGVKQLVGKDTEGQPLDYLTLNEANNWTGMVRGVELLDPDTGKYHEYTWKEFIFGEDGTGRIYPVDGKITFTVNGRSGIYTATEDGVDELENEPVGTITFITKLTNHYQPETISVTAEKVWAGETWPDGTKFTGLRKPVKLRLEGFYETEPAAAADGETARAAAEPEKHYLTDTGIQEPVKEIGEDGTAVWTNLPRYHDGHEITYQVTEIEGPEEYTVSYASGSGEAQKTDGTVVGGTVTVTNTLKTGSLEITKTMFVNDDKAAADAKDTVEAVYDAQKTHAFYVKVSTKIGDDTWYVTSSNGLLKKDLTADDQTIWPVTMAAPLTISGLPVGEYTVTEVDANGNALTSATGKIGSMTFVPMLSRMTETVQVEDGDEAAEASLVNKYTTGKYCIAVTKQWLVDEKAYTDDTLKVKVELQRTTTPDDEDSYLPVQRAKTEGEGTEPYKIELNKENNWSAMALGQEQMDENGDRYSYRWIEVEDTIPEGWTQGETSVPQQMEVDGTLLIFLTKLTNNMTLTQVSVEKNWEDETNQDGIRPAEVTVELLANGKPVDQAVLSASNEWKHLFDKLPTRKDDKPVTYAVREINVPDGYEVSYSSGTGEKEKKDGTVAAAGSVQVINTHTPKTVDVTAKKVWDDNHNQDGKRAEVTLVLSGTYTVTDEEGNETEEHVTIADAEKKITNLTTDETEVTWEGLPEKQKGQTVVYCVTEKNTTAGTGEDEGKTIITLNGAAYEVTVDGLTVTNSYHPAETETTVTKVWTDNSNHDGKRPETLQVVLTETVGEGEDAKTFDTPYTLSAANATDKNTWSLTLTNLPMYKNGQPVRYSWSEPEDQVPAGYTLMSTETEGTVTTITNEHQDEKTRSTVIKAWEDEKDQLGLRPEKITVKLYADNAETGTEVTLPITDEAGNKVWEYTAKDLIKYNEKGDEIAYSWMEDTTGLSNGYYLKSLATVRTEDNTTGETETTTTITNKYDPEQVTRTVIKVWEDDADSEGFRPETLTVRLYKGEGSAKTQVGGDYVLNKGNNWSVTTAALPKHENGEEINYYFEEVEPENGQYTGTTEIEGTATILTNTHIPTKTSTTVRKIWNDAGNQDGIRPDHIDLKLFKGEGEAKVQIRTIRLSGTGDTWTYTESNLPKYEKGAEIVYSWEEYDQPAGYQSDEPTLNAETGAWEITNTHTPKVIDVTAKKVWNDAGNQDGRRAEVTLKLSGTYTVGTVEKQVTIEDAEKTIKDLTADEAEVTWTGLPEKMEGQQVIYTVTETGTMKKDGKTWITLNDADYEVNISGLTVTNSLTPETTSASVKKVWQDEDDQDGLRPGALEVKLYANQDYLTSMLLAAENGWSATVSGLPKYDKGQAIEYEWQETVPEGYTQGVPVTTSGVTTLTNTHTPAETKAEVRKLWKDDDNRDGKRPGSVTMVLMKNNVAQEGQTVELNEANEWKGEITGLPKYEDGDEIVYSFMEQAVADYSISDIRFERIPEEAAAERAETKTFTRTTIENTYTPGRFCLTVVKVWNDNHDQDGRRPESVTVRLLANRQPAKYADGSEVAAIELNAGNNWTGMATGLPINAGGDPIQYSWEEDPAAGYTGDGPALVNLTTRVTAITNTLQPEETEISVTKRWEDGDNQDGLRPDYVTVELLANGSPVGETTVKAENGWTAKFEHLPKFRRGQVIEYKVREIFVPAGYEPEVTGSAAEGYTIINRHVSETVKATVRKVWDDGNDQDKIRPKVLKVQLLSNGTELQEITLTAENGWTAEAEGLPKYSGGKEIAYTWTEETAEGYELISTEQNGTVTTLTNRHQTDTVTAEVEKKWADQENLYGGRPEEIQVVLKADGKIIDSDTLNAENGWTAKREGLPAKKDGETISYSWEEIAVPAGYEMTAETASGKTVITNTWLAETTEATVKKVWIHNGNPEVPEELKVILTDGKEFSKEIVLNEENGWTATESGLPARDGEGQAIAYSWTEAEMPEGYTLTETSVSGSVTTFVNTYGIETSLTVKKVWNDGETEHEPITVKLMKNGTEEVKSFELSGDNEWTATAENLPVTEEGQAVSYSWQEVSVPGYVSSVTVQGRITVITNTPIPSAKGEFSASKTWTGSEGGSATLTLTGRVRNTDGSLTTVSSSSQTVSGNGTARWSETPLFTEEGQPIFYALTENGVAADGTMGDYISTITGDEESGYIVYNHAKPEPEIIRIPGEKEIIYVPSEAPDPTTSATVVKVWDDMDNAYNTRKDSIEVTLDNTGDTYTLSAANNWTVTVEDLKLKDESGNRIQYTWTEKTTVSGYTQTKSVTGNVTVITNRYRPEPVPEEPETIDASVKKVWDDDNNAYGTRPTDLNVTLSNGDTYTLNEANHWSATAENLPAEDADGNEIIYTWTEQPIPNYTLADTSVIGRTTVLTNRYRPEPVPEEPETVTVGVKKIWDDDDNAYRTRPANLTVTLSNGDAYTLNAGNGWSVTVEGLPAADASGNAIAYSWTEERVTNYTLTDVSMIGNTTVLTNRYRPAPRPATTTATVVKVWDDENNAYETRPANVRMTLSNGQSYTLNAENNWSLTVGDLPAEDAGGNAIAYTWTEQPVPGYTMTGMTVSGNTTVFTNRYRPAPETPEKEVPTTSATVVKVWDDDGNEYGLRPANIRVTLSNGQSYVLSEANNWSMTVEDLPAEQNGEPIVYTWTEQSVPGYQHVSTTTAGDTTIFTNRYRPLIAPPTPEDRKTGTPLYLVRDYGTPLGVGVTINHVGDCYE